MDSCSSAYFMCASLNHAARRLSAAFYDLISKLMDFATEVTQRLQVPG